jgi:excisionase family DNA binding protein
MGTPAVSPPLAAVAPPTQQLADLLALAGTERAELVLALMRELLLMPSPEGESPGLLTLEQVATRVQVHPRTIRRAIDAGQLAAIELPFRGGIRVRTHALDEWLDEHPAAPETSRPALAAPGSGRLEMSDL